jgi:hypothetical protein
MKNFCFLFYSNETYLPILDLTLGEFNYYFNNNPFKKYVVSNKFTDYIFTNKNATFLNSNVDFEGQGRHFSQTMEKALSLIDEEYIIFFCDDYMLIDSPNLNNLIEICRLVEEHKIDYFTFGSTLPKKDWVEFNFESEILPQGRKFFLMPDNFHYLYSVQPCIWKKQALLEILKYNPTLSLHDLDTANLKNRQGYNREMDYLTSLWKKYPFGEQSYGFKTVCTDFKAYDELENFEFLVFPYIEIIRHGFFNITSLTNTYKFLNKFIEDRKIKDNPFFKKYIP